MAWFHRVLTVCSLVVYPGLVFAGAGLSGFDISESDGAQEQPIAPPINFITQMLPLATFGADYLEAWSITIDADAMRYGPSSIALYLPGQPPDVIAQLRWEARSGYVPSGTGGGLVPNPAADASEFSWRWYGKSDRFTVALTMVDGVLAGRIGAPNDIHYDIAPSPSGEILGVTNSAFWVTHPSEGGESASDDADGELLESRSSSPMAPTGTWDYTCSTALAPGYHNVDVLMMYTPGILTAYGSIAALTAAGQAALDDANQALRNVSVTSYSYNLIGVSAVDTSHSYDTETITLALDHLSGIQSLGMSPWCTYPGNTYVSSQRSSQHADIVTLARRDTTGENSCGYSRVQHRQTSNSCPREVGPSSSPFAYMVFDPGCNADRLNMAHEMGHLLGMEHDPRNANTSLTGALASCPWSFGHRRSDGTTTSRFNFRTIMAYWQAGTGTAGPPGCLSSAGCPQIDAYSDPNLEWDGFDDGINPPPWGLNPLGTLSGASPIGVQLPVGGRRAARAIDTLPRIAPIVEAFYARPEQIFANGFERKK
jgi:hypothetical protein